MAHEFESGFVVGEQAWHGLAKVLPLPPASLEEAIMEAGLNWRVQKQSIYDADSKPVKGYTLLTRSTDGKHLSVVGERYTPLQNAEAFEILRKFIDDGSLVIDTAGSLSEGKLVWMQAKIPNGEGEVSKGDSIATRLMISAGHDGLHGLFGGWSATRAVCLNTVKVVHQTETKVTARHRPNILQARDVIAEAIDVAHRDFTITLEAYRAMKAQNIKVQGLRKYVVSVLWPETLSLVTQEVQAGTDADTIVDKAIEEHKRIYGQIEENFQSGDDAKLSGETVWGAYNAVTKYLSHQKGRTEAQRFHSLHFGQSKPLLDRAFKEAQNLLVSA